MSHEPGKRIPRAGRGGPPTARARPALHLRWPRLLATLLLAAVGLPVQGVPGEAGPLPGDHRFEVREGTLVLWANEAMVDDILVSLQTDYGVSVAGAVSCDSNVSVTCSGRFLHEVLRNLDMSCVLFYGAESDPNLHQLRRVELSDSGDDSTQDRRHAIRFSSGGDLELFHTGRSDAWTVREGELVGSSGRGNEKPFLTYGIAFESMDRVRIRGRIIPPGTENLRLSVGTVNLIFNWEVRDENHYRNGTDLTVQAGPALQPGVVHDIEVVQEGEDAVVLVDEREVYRTATKLEGTVTVYPAHGSSIGISDMLIEGTPDHDRVVEGHSHPNTL